MKILRISVSFYFSSSSFWEKRGKRCSWNAVSPHHVVGLTSNSELITPRCNRVVVTWFYDEPYSISLRKQSSSVLNSTLHLSSIWFLVGVYQTLFRLLIAANKNLLKTKLVQVSVHFFPAAVVWLWIGRLYRLWIHCPILNWLDTVSRKPNLLVTRIAS